MVADLFAELVLARHLDAIYVLDYMTPREARALLTHLRDTEREAWQRTRAQVYATLRPFLSDPDARPESIMPLPWDPEAAEPPTAADLEEVRRWAAQFNVTKTDHATK